MDSIHRGVGPSLLALQRHAEAARSAIGIRPQRKSRGIRIAYIPDLQDKPGAPQAHASWIGRWLRDRAPDVAVLAGDGPDMGSCSHWDEPGSLRSEGRSVVADLWSFKALLARMAAAAGGRWDKMDKRVTLGNHEDRLRRHVNAHPELRHAFEDDPFGYEGAGIRVHPFLVPVEIAGTWFSHFFPRAASGRVVTPNRGAPNALAMVRREMRSCVAGHAQGLDVACLPVGGRVLRGVIAGSCYLHTEDYLTPQGQNHWAGVLELNEAHDGYFDLCEVSLEYLCEKYGNGRWPTGARRAR